MKINQSVFLKFLKKTHISETTAGAAIEVPRITTRWLVQKTSDVHRTLVMGRFKKDGTFGVPNYRIITSSYVSYTIFEKILK